MSDWTSEEYWTSGSYYDLVSSDRSDSEPDHPTSEAGSWDLEPDTRASKTKAWVPRSAQGDSEPDSRAAETGSWASLGDTRGSEPDGQASETVCWGSEPVNLVVGAEWDDTRADIWVPYKYHRDSEFGRCPSEPDWPPRLNHWSARPAFRRHTRMGRPSTYVFDSNGDTCITLHTSKYRPFSFSGDTLSNVPSNEVSRSEFHVSCDWGEVAHKDCDAASVDSSDSRHKYHEYGKIPGSSPGQVEIRVLVSGRHLKLGSDYFTELFSSPRAGQLIGDSGLYEIQARGWDPVAHQTVLAILHGYHKDVPKSPSIELLAELTMVVDYYGCHESVEPHAKVWLEHLRSNLPTEYGSDCILSIAISWVFDDQDIFQKMTELVLTHSHGLIKVEDDRLPLPDGLLDEINASRQCCLEFVTTAILDLYHFLTEDHDGCNTCSTMMLGTLTKEMYKLGWKNQDERLSLQHFSIEDCTQLIDSVHVPKVHSYDGCRRGSTLYETLLPALMNANQHVPVFCLAGKKPMDQQEPEAQPEPDPYAHDEW
ncbi:hypothetical protein FPSE_00268 [Fusarium pseudograminearum CS3096]|uniref:BTB domain-containing protein n=1 Tax=Fusarium pseudograminearum (strain CS3096) TaxID=1028729 RepID=K3VWM5_FUSPC|nr:hypothetical protein FPSE_00268 [Fusarium pseudograminearum CS3096]EKJ79583.1 hypothetical protein FPSE_00268 [Fusarium pseudograminearum CS3096]